MADSIQDIVDSLNDLLDEERMALLDGNLDLIGRMLNRKETLIDSLNDLAKPDVKVMSFSLVVLLFGTIAFLILAKDTPLNSAWNP